MILKARNLKKYYNNVPNVVKAVDGIDLSVTSGEFLSIVGASGSGKSTLLHLLGGLDAPTEGNIFIDDISLEQLDADRLTIFRRKKIGFIFQNFNLVPTLNIYDNIILPIALDNTKLDLKYIDSVVNLLKLQEKLTRLPNQLSGGEQQRVAIARALVSRPALILADEPTGNLDSQTSKSVLSLFQEANRVFNQTIIMITHNDEIANLTDRIIRIEDGKIAGDYLPERSHHFE